MKNIKVEIVNNQTLKLLEDAKAGDLIDLNSVTSINTELILNKIKEAKDLVYLTELAKVTDTLKREEALKTEILENRLKAEIDTLKKTLTNKETEVKNMLALEHERIVSKYKEEAIKLNNIIEMLRSNEKTSLDNLRKELNNDFAIKELKNDNIIKDLKYKAELSLRDLNLELDNLKREKSSQNVKMIGEDLEVWADNKFNENQLVQPDNIKWYKDNKVVSGGKADFIYEVYSTKEELSNVLLTSAILEMKSEDPLATNKQNISTILKKLDSDRNNKNIEYAILVSEIDFNNNDLYIEKVREYDKMFIVRPQYFMTILNVITAFALKYEDILLKKAKEAIKFKDSDEILSDFEAMKDDILNNQVRHINTQLGIIRKQSDDITNANNKLLEALDKIAETHLNALINKINNFNIKKIVKKVDEV